MSDYLLTKAALLKERPSLEEEEEDEIFIGKVISQKEKQKKKKIERKLEENRRTTFLFLGEGDLKEFRENALKQPSLDEQRETTAVDCIESLAVAAVENRTTSSEEQQNSFPLSTEEHAPEEIDLVETKPESSVQEIPPHTEEWNQDQTQITTEGDTESVVEENEEMVIEESREGEEGTVEETVQSLPSIESSQEMVRTIPGPLEEVVEISEEHQLVCEKPSTMEKAIEDIVTESPQQSFEEIETKAKSEEEMKEFHLMDSIASTPIDSVLETVQQTSEVPSTVEERKEGDLFSLDFSFEPSGPLQDQFVTFPETLSQSVETISSPKCKESQREEKKVAGERTVLAEVTERWQRQMASLKSETVGKVGTLAAKKRLLAAVVAQKDFLSRVVSPPPSAPMRVTARLSRLPLPTPSHDFFLPKRLPRV